MVHSEQIEDRHLDSFSLCALRLAHCVMGQSKAGSFGSRFFISLGEGKQIER
jgi:hypothetical protein